MAKVYVGGISTSATEADVEDEFVKFGPLRSVWLARKPPGFAFVEFEDSRDADAAIRKLDGSNGWRVELSRKTDRGPRGGGGGGGYGDRDRGGFGGGGGGGGMRSDMKCYNCGEAGHFSRECPRGPRDGGGRRDDRGGGGGGDRDRDRGYERSRYRSRSPVQRRGSPAYSPARPARRSPSYGGRSPSRSPAKD